MVSDPIQAAEDIRPPFDSVFPRLVDEASDQGQKLIGFVAYGLYHEAKREWTSDFREREKRYPLEEELRAYERSWTASRLDALRNAAAQVIAAYTDVVIIQAEKQILRSALKGNFRRVVWGSVIGLLLYTLAILGLAFALARSGISLTGVLSAVMSPEAAGAPH